MLQRPFGSTGRRASAIGLGTWQLGAVWGDVSDDLAAEILEASITRGVTIFDTADKYGDGRSEQLIGRFLASHPGQGVTVATKMGRRLPQRAENYSLSNFREWVARSRRNLGVATLDVVQLHCPPTAVLEDAATYEALERLVDEGEISAYGVSVETCAQALTVLEMGAPADIQIVFNPFRLKPLDEVIPAAAEAGVAVLARVPLASGLLAGRYTSATTFPANDPRTYNAHGQAFDRGETFAGVEFTAGVDAARELAEGLPDAVGLAAASLAWIATRPGVTTVIPGARTVAQATANADAAALIEAGLDLDAFDERVRDVYDRRLRASVHSQW